MSYCRWSDESDVYLYAHVAGGWECCGCFLEEQTTMTTLQDVLDHLQAHRDAGHKVLESAFDRVRSEIEEYGADSTSPYARQV